MGVVPMEADTQRQQLAEEKCKKAIVDTAAQIGADQDLAERAFGLLRTSAVRFQEMSDSESQMQYWAASSLMAASLANKALPVASVIKAAGGQMKVTDFFERTKLALKGKSGDHGKSELHVRRLERAFMVTADVFRKYCTVFSRIVRDFNVDQAKSMPDGDSAKQLFRTLWLFYIVFKARIFHSGNEKSPLLDQVPAFHFLVACLVFCTEPMSRSRLNAEEDPPKKLAKTDVTGVSDTIRSLCEGTNAIHGNVLRFIESLKQCVQSDILSLLPVAISSDGEKRQKLFKQLSSEYEHLVENPVGDGTIDERFFTDASELLGKCNSLEQIDSPKRPRMGSQGGNYISTLTESNGAPLDALDALAAVAFVTPRSPCESKPPKPMPDQPQTPVYVSVVAVSWLQNVARVRPETPAADSSASARPSKICQRMISKDAWDEIYNRASKLLNSALCKIYDSSIAKERVREALALYFASVEGVLLAEEKRLKHSNFNNLLSNETFHRALLASAAESASVAYGRREFSPFPAVLVDFELEAFDMTKVIESFLRHTPGLPKTIAKHLIRCEERILECLAWTPKSHLCRTLEQREQMFLEEETREPKTRDSAEDAELMSLSQSTQDIISSSQLSDGLDEKLEQSGNLPNWRDNPYLHVEQDEQKKSGQKKSGLIPDAALEIFFRKLLFITSVRVQDLAARVGLNDAQSERVWAAMKLILSNKWRLMVGRHLDQMIICCIYGVAKVSKDFPSLKFSDITHWYKTLPHAREPSFQQFVHSIYIDVKLEGDGDNQKRGDIIKFYNKVFVQRMKSFLMSTRNLAEKNAKDGIAPSQDLGLAQENLDSRDPLKAQISCSPMRRKVEPPPRSVGKVKVTAMSPSGRIQMSRAGFGTPVHTMSPATRTLYAFGESPILGLHRVNRDWDEGRRLLVGNKQVADGEGPGVHAIRRKYADVFAVGTKSSNSPQARALPKALQFETSNRRPPIPPSKNES